MHINTDYSIRTYVALKQFYSITAVQCHLWKKLWTNHEIIFLYLVFLWTAWFTLAVNKKWIFCKSDICQECNSVNCCKVALWWLKCCIAKSPQKSHKLCVLGHHRTATQWGQSLYKLSFTYYFFWLPRKKKSTKIFL